MSQHVSGRFRLDRAVVDAAALATVVIAILLRAHSHVRPEFYDEGVYRLLVRNLLGDHYFGYSPGGSVAYRAPGFAFFDAGIRSLNDSFTAVLVAQAVLAGAIVWTTGWIARRLFGGIAGAVAALLLIATATITVYASFELSETVSTATLVSGIALALVAYDRRSARFAVAGGMLLGLSILARPQTIVLPAVIAGAMVLAHRRDRGRVVVAVALLGASIATVVPWTARNYARLHAFVPVSTYGGVNFYIANNRHADGRFHRADEVMPDPLYTLITAQPEAEADRWWFRYAVRYIRHHPADSVHNWIVDGYFYLKTDDWLVQENYVVRSGRQSRRLDDRLLWPLAFAGLAAVAFRKERMRNYLSALVVAYFIGFFMLFVPLPRFRHGVIPFLAVYAGAGVTALVDLARRRSRGRPAPEEPHPDSAPAVEPLEV